MNPLLLIVLLLKRVLYLSYQYLHGVLSSMKEVDAIKDQRVLNLIPLLLEKHHGVQYAQLWELGINVALRISDLLNIQFSNIQGERLHLVESKTDKVANISMNSKALEIVNTIKSNHPTHHYLFQSFNSRNLSGRIKPLSRQTVSAAFSNVGNIVGVRLNTHSMRKTRGYHLYQQTKDITRVSAMLRHSSTAVTMRYIGITQDGIDADFNALVL